MFSHGCFVWIGVLLELILGSSRIQMGFPLVPLSPDSGDPPIPNEGQHARTHRAHRLDASTRPGAVGTPTGGALDGEEGLDPLTWRTKDMRRMR